MFKLFVQTPRRQKKLFCRYHDGNRNPKFILAPAKQEDEWDKPRIIRFHDIISDAEIEIVKDLAKPRVNNFFLFFSPQFTCVSAFPLQDYKNDNWHDNNPIDSFRYYCWKLMELTKLYLYQFFSFYYQYILHTLYVTLQLGFKHWIMKIIGDIFIHT